MFFIVPHVDIELEDNKQFISNIPRICWINVTPGSLLPCDPMNDHLLYLGHCDLYVMVQ